MQLSPHQPHCRTFDRLRRVRFQEFEPVAPRIFGEKASSAGERIIVGDFHGVGEKRFAELGEIWHGESRVSLFRRAKISFDADMKLLLAALEPGAAPSAQRGRLFDLAQPEDRAKKFAGRCLAALRSGQLDVVDSRNQVVCLGDHAVWFGIGYLQRAVFIPRARDFLSAASYHQCLHGVFGTRDSRSGCRAPPSSLVFRRDPQ